LTDPAERAGGDAVVAVSVSDFLWFVDLALDKMVEIVRQLGDDKASQRPALDGANAPYAILTHCLGVMEFWGGEPVAGRTIARDRAAEFRAQGRIEELVARTREARAQLETDLNDLQSMSPPSGPVRPKDAAVPYGKSKGAVLLHVLEELFQHLGHMEISRDVLLAGD
jgi:uncharacterized protein YbjQ (UPF0145 family)